MAIDLSFLEDAPAPAAPAASPAPAPTAAPAAVAPKPDGKAVEFALADIDEDENQPRREYDEAKMEELTESVKKSGVISPISIKPHPHKSGRWIINHGHRRFRASHRAGKTTIPAHVSEAHGEYDQMIENLQRDDLTPLEIAEFIQKRIKANDKQNDIAKRLGKRKEFVTFHLVLIDPPACVEAAYTSGKTRSVQTLYALRAIYDKHPEQVAAWVDEQTEITRKAVDDLAQELGGKKKTKATPAAASAPDTGTKGEGRQEPRGDGEGGSGDAEGGSKAGGVFHEKLPAGEGGAGEGTTTKPKQSDPNAISRPLLIVEFDGRAAAVLLNRRPSTAGLVWIKYEDGGGEEEIDAGQCKINRLMDGSP